jgi:hypothetical protein
MQAEEVRKFSEDFAIMLEWFDRVGYHADINGRADEAHVKPLTFSKWADGANWS